jgi:hypothetical protein
MSDDRSVADAPAKTFTTVIEELRAWEPAGRRSIAASERVRGYLDNRLNDPDESPWERDVVERRRGSTAADLSVNGEIGVMLVSRVGPVAAGELRVAIQLLAERYNYVVVYWLDGSPAGVDGRRSVKRSVSAARLDLDELEFVAAPSPAPTADRSLVGATFVAAGSIRRAVPALIVSALAGVVLGWAAVATAGLGRAFLVGVAGLFAGTLVSAMSLANR